MRKIRSRSLRTLDPRLYQIDAERRVDTLLVVDDENYFKGYMDIDTITAIIGGYVRSLSTDMPTVANDTLVRQTVRKMLN